MILSLLFRKKEKPLKEKGKKKKEKGNMKKRLKNNSDILPHELYV